MTMTCPVTIWPGNKIKRAHILCKLEVTLTPLMSSTHIIAMDPAESQLERPMPGRQTGSVDSIVFC